MNYADQIFKQNLKEILNEEFEIDNRAKWKDGTQVYTKRIISVVNKYDLSKEFPAITLRPIGIKSVFKELDWIYRKRSNNINDLGLKIWDSWADENGSVGKTYGYQISKPVFGYDNQIDYILGEIQKNPTSRRLVVEMWNVNELSEMNLPPCYHNLQFLVKNGKLHLILKQRSLDMITAGNWDVVLHALLVHMIARHCNLEVGTLTHIIGDMHIYNKHIDQAYEMLNRKSLEAPKFWLNSEVKNFYDFTESDVKLIYKEKHPQLKFEVAI